MKTQPITEYSKEALNKISEHIEFLERRINFYTQGIKGYLDIKECHKKSVLISINSIDKVLIDIQNAKKYGTKQQLQTLKNNLNWWQNQLKFDKKGVKWSNERIKNNKTELAFYQKKTKELIKEILI
jgi:hypothetical protein